MSWPVNQPKPKNVLTQKWLRKALAQTDNLSEFVATLAALLPGRLRLFNRRSGQQPINRIHILNVSLSEKSGFLQHHEPDGSDVSFRTPPSCPTASGSDGSAGRFASGHTDD